MIAAIKEICIFMIIAQAVLLLVPGNAYMKYVRVLVGILMVLMITRPIFALFMGEEGADALARQLKELKAGVPQEITGFSKQQEKGENVMGIYSSIEEELKNKLNRTSGLEALYYVEAVSLKGECVVGSGEKESRELIEYIQLTVRENKESSGDPIEITPISINGENLSEKEEAGFSEDVEEALKTRYGQSIGVDPERIKIVKSYG